MAETLLDVTLFRFIFGFIFDLVWSLFLGLSYLLDLITQENTTHEWYSHVCLILDLLLPHYIWFRPGLVLFYSCFPSPPVWLCRTVDEQCKQREHSQLVRSILLLSPVSSLLKNSWINFRPPPIVETIPCGVSMRVDFAAAWRSESKCNANICPIDWRQ